ncbi:respiratory nitrate reductase 2 gamma chain [Escherichia coli]|uniref:Respiratory nitrate reductase 2 gamma chain n=1 Tax=Escherichia coli TaxID=562 RepID=A0A376U9I9_ECOLX|nr:respiratory nitrate reductase 2 gamma chain [Escherichia coli]
MIQYLNVFFYDIYPYICATVFFPRQLAALRLRAVHLARLLKSNAR